MYIKITVEIEVGTLMTQKITVIKRLKQGCTISPLLLNIFRDRILQKWNRHCERKVSSYEEKDLRDEAQEDRKSVETEDDKPFRGKI